MVDTSAPGSGAPPASPEDEPDDEATLTLWQEEVSRRYSPRALRARSGGFEPVVVERPRPEAHHLLWLYSAAFLQFAPFQRMNPYQAILALALPWLAILCEGGFLRGYLLILFVAATGWPAIDAWLARAGVEWGSALLLTGLVPLGLLALRGMREKHRLLPVLALLAGIFLALGPGTVAPMFPLAWLAPVPLALWAIEPLPRGIRLAGGYLASAVGFAAAFGWVHHTSGAGVTALGLYLGLFGLAGVIAVGVLTVRGGLALCLSVPIVTVALDWVRAHLFTGIPWFFLGHAPVPWLEFVQIADLGGSYLLTAVVAFGGGALADLAVRARWGWTADELLTAPRTLVPLLLAAAAVAGSWAYGRARIPDVRSSSRPGPTLLLVQGNIPQDVKSAGEDRWAMMATHLDLLARNDRPVDLVVWAETMFPWTLSYDPARGTYPDPAGMGDPYAGNEAWNQLRSIPARARAPCLLGAIYREPGEDRSEPRWPGARYYNSAVFVERDGRVGPRYDKIHLVPGSECIPLRGRFPPLDRLFNRLAGVELEPLQSGASPVIMTLDGRKFGALICYESIFSDLVGDYVRGGAEFLVNLSNDGWFKESQELDQMLDMTVLRAIESRTGIVRATNTGISAFITPTGELDAVLTGSDGRRKSVAGLLRRAVTLGPCDSVYLRRGDWAAGLLVATALASLAGLRLWRSRRRS